MDGKLVSECTSNWETHLNCDIWSICRELLGAMPEERDRQQSTIKFTLLKSTFLTLDVDAFEETIAHHTCEYILELLGGFLLAEALASRVSLKWLPLLRDFRKTGRLSWGSILLDIASSRQI